MIVNLGEIDPSVGYIVFYIRSRSNANSDGFDSSSMYLMDSFSKRDLAFMDYEDERSRSATFLLPCILTRSRSRWFFLNSSFLCFSESLEEFLISTGRYLKESSSVQDPYCKVKVSLSEGDEYILDTSTMSSVQFGLNWELPKEDFGAAVVSFDKLGHFIEGVDMRRPQSRTGPAIKYSSLGVPKGGKFEVDLGGSAQENVFCYFLVVAGKLESSELRQLGAISTRLLDGNIEFCCWKANVNMESSSAVILARVWKSNDNPKVYTMYICFVTAFFLNTFFGIVDLDFQGIQGL